MCLKGRRSAPASTPKNISVTKDVVTLFIGLYELDKNLCIYMIIEKLVGGAVAATGEVIDVDSSDNTMSKTSIEIAIHSPGTVNEPVSAPS